MEIRKKIQIVKLDWRLPSDFLTPDEQEAVRAVAEKHLGEEHIDSVLTACSFFRWRLVNILPTEQRRHQSRNQRAEKKRGRPKGVQDWSAKELVNKLAVIWEAAGGTLPHQYMSAFGKFVSEIAKVLNVRNAKGLVTWNGITNEVLREGKYARLRKAPASFGGPIFFRRKLAEVEDSSLRKKREDIEATIRAGRDAAILEAAEIIQLKIQLEEKFKEIPGAEKYTLDIKRRKT